MGVNKKMLCAPRELLETLRSLVGGATSSLDEEDRALAEELDRILAGPDELLEGLTVNGGGV